MVETGFNVSRCHAPISRPGIVIALTRVKGGTTGFYCDSDSVRRSNFETNERREIAKFFFKESFLDPSFFSLQNLNLAKKYFVEDFDLKSIESF